MIKVQVIAGNGTSVSREIITRDSAHAERVITRLKGLLRTGSSITFRRLPV
jgi:hypothetical protein